MSNSNQKNPKNQKNYNPVYGSKEWNEKREAFLKVHNTCQWCGSTEFLAINHTYELRDEIRSQRNAAEHEIVDQMIKDKVSCGAIKNNWLGKQGYKDFITENQAEIQKRLTSYGLPNEPEYLDFTEETVIVLCRRCHCAYEHGLDKCPTCDGYKQRAFPICRKCKDKKQKRLNDEFSNSAVFKEAVDGFKKYREDLKISGQQDCDDSIESLADDLDFSPYDHIPYGDIMRNTIPTADEIMLNRIFNVFNDPEESEGFDAKWAEIRSKVEQSKLTEAERVEAKRVVVHELIEYLWNITGQDNRDW